MPVFPAVPSTTVPPGCSLNTCMDVFVVEYEREIAKDGMTNAPTVGLCCFDDAKRGSVLHTTTWVLEFRLAIYF